MNMERTDWHHAPLHIFVPNTVYMVTGATLHKQHFYLGRDRLEILKNALLAITEIRGWEPRAWAIFSNHYHFIARSPVQQGALCRLVQHIHSEAARRLNLMDNTPGRKVWYQYWDKCITYEKSYYPRLHYVLKNAVHHKLVPLASQYPFCSAGSFEARASGPFRKKVESFRFDRLNESDDFEPQWG
jgi:putative transposase